MSATLLKDTMGIIIAAYNAQNTIAFTITSVKNQSDIDFSCVIVDDGSADSTYAVALDAIDQDSRFVLIRKSNGGAASARNRAVQELKTKYFFYVDADDTIEPTFIEDMRAYISDYPGFGAYSANALLESKEKSYKFYQIEKPKKITFQEICDDCCIIGGGTIIEKQIFDNLNGFDEKSYAEDYDFWLRFYASRHKLIAFPKVLYHYKLDASALRKTHDWRSGILSARDSLKALLDLNCLTEEEKNYISQCIDKNETLYTSSQMFEYLGGQKERLQNTLTKYFGKRVARIFITFLSKIAPLLRRFRIYFALNKVQKDKNEH